MAKSQEPNPFVKLYFADMSKLYGVSKLAGNLFFEMCQLISTNTLTFPNVIFLSSNTKKELAVKAQIVEEGDTSRNIYNTNKYLSELVKAGLLEKIDTNTFIANPDVVSRVDWKLAQLIKSVECRITYSHLGRNIVTIIEEQNSNRTGDNNQLGVRDL